MAKTGHAKEVGSTNMAKVFEAFDKIPTLVWEDEYRKYSEVLNAYKDIRIARWGSEIK